jgi:VanZ family protein
MAILGVPKKYYKALFYVTVIVVFYLAVAPNDHIKIDSHYADKIKHISAFFTLSLLLNRASSTIQHRLRNMGALLLFGIFIEIAQLFFPNRESSVDDILADLIGILLFQLLYTGAKYLQIKIKKEQ